ncbi:MAG: zinc ribbon domain-containing protein [Pyrinomonadaceae bacterium]
MFCPKCSQQQISDETRFCSRCGFQLNIVKALLASDDAPQPAEIQKADRSLRKRDMTIGAGVMFFFALIAAAITVDMPPSHSSRIVLLFAAWLILTLLINIKPIIQYFLRADNSAPATDDFSVSKTFSKFTSRGKNALPEARGIPAADLIMPNLNTAEMIQPPSVTENTTNLLER